MTPAQQRAKAEMDRVRPVAAALPVMTQAPEPWAGFIAALQAPGVTDKRETYPKAWVVQPSDGTPLDPGDDYREWFVETAELAARGWRRWPQALPPAVATQDGYVVTGPRSQRFTATRAYGLVWLQSGASIWVAVIPWP